MFETTITMSCKRGVYQPHEIIEINGEKFLITAIEREASYPFNDLLHLEDFQKFLSKTRTITIGNICMSIADYLELIATNKGDMPEKIQEEKTDGTM